MRVVGLVLNGKMTNLCAVPHFDDKEFPPALLQDIALLNMAENGGYFVFCRLFELCYQTLDRVFTLCHAVLPFSRKYRQSASAAAFLSRNIGL